MLLGYWTETHRSPPPTQNNRPDTQGVIGAVVRLETVSSVADRESVEHDPKILDVDQTVLIEIPPTVVFVSVDRIEKIQNFVDLG